MEAWPVHAWPALELSLCKIHHYSERRCTAGRMGLVPSQLRDRDREWDQEVVCRFLKDQKTGRESPGTRQKWIKSQEMVGRDGGMQPRLGGNHVSVMTKRRAGLESSSRTACGVGITSICTSQSGSLEPLALEM